jgi:hypothetical protein
VDGAPGTLAADPALRAIQRSFGRHDVSGVQAHVGGVAEKASSDMGATAYATGSSVAFRSSPDLHTAAHEAAHVVQQRGGVQLKAGVGEAGDAHERHADAVADLVVEGRSAEGLLDRHAGGGGAGGGVQMKQVKTAHGVFEDVYYGNITNEKDQEIGCEMYSGGDATIKLPTKP